MSHDEWLIQNKNLRMDANLPVFAEARRRFHLERYQFASAYCTNKKVLDGACGTGYGSEILGLAASEVIGIDCDSDTIRYASDTYAKQNVRFEQSYVELTDFAPESFDVVVSFETVEHTLCPISHITEITRLLTPNGCAVLSVPNGWGLTDHHFWDFDANLLRKLIEPRFGDISYYYDNSNSSGGRRQGIGPITSPSNQESAECIIAICRRKNPVESVEDRYTAVMNEIYSGVFERHQEFIALKHKHSTGDTTMQLGIAGFERLRDWPRRLLGRIWPWSHH